MTRAPMTRAFTEPVAGGIPAARRIQTRMLLSVHSSSTNALWWTWSPKALLDLIPKLDSQV